MRTNQIVIIKRLMSNPANINIKSWVEVKTIRAMLLPLGAERRQIAAQEGIMGKAFMLYTKISDDIRETDRVVIDAREYDVRGAKRYEGSRTVDHCEFLIEQRKE